jgi:hypothetical protein
MNSGSTQEITNENFKRIKPHSSLQLFLPATETIWFAHLIHSSVYKNSHLARELDTRYITHAHNKTNKTFLCNEKS